MKVDAATSISSNIPLPMALLALVDQAMDRLPPLTLARSFGWGYEDSAVVGWLCFVFRMQAVLIAAPIAGLILLDLVAYVLMRTLHISARRVRVRAAVSPPVPAAVALPPSPKLSSAGATPTAEDDTIALAPPAVSPELAALKAVVTPADEERSPTTSLNMSPSSQSSSMQSADWTHITSPLQVSSSSLPLPIVSYGSALSGVSTASSSSSVSSASELPIGGLGLSGTGSRRLSSVELDPTRTAELLSSGGGSGSSKTHRRNPSFLGKSSPLLTLSPISLTGEPASTTTTDDHAPPPTASTASSPAPSCMTTPGLRHRALPPIGPSSESSQQPSTRRSLSDDVQLAAARLKHSRARAASVGVEGALGLNGEDEDEGEESDDEASSSTDIGTPGVDGANSAGLRRRATVRG